jgi:hypothetical protein
MDSSVGAEGSVASISELVDRLVGTGTNPHSGRAHGPALDEPLSDLGGETAALKTREKEHAEPGQSHM